MSRGRGSKRWPMSRRDRDLWDAIPAMTDRAAVLQLLEHQHSWVRESAAQWFQLDQDPVWAQDVSGWWGARAALRLGHGPMPLEAVARLLDDPSGSVASEGIARCHDIDLLVEVALREEPDDERISSAVTRLFELDADDALVAAARRGRPVPEDALWELAYRSTDPQVLDELIDTGACDRGLLNNPAITDEQIRRIVGTVPPGRPGDDPATWAPLLRAGAVWFADNTDLPNPGGHESAELRDCMPAAGVLYGACVPLCRAAADVVRRGEPTAEWAQAAVTWALELVRVCDGDLAVWARLPALPGRLTRRYVPAPRHDAFTRAAGEARRRAAEDVRTAKLAEGAALLLEALAEPLPGSLPWLKQFGGGTGYDGFHAFAILAIRTAKPVVAALAADDEKGSTASG